MIFVLGYPVFPADMLARISEFRAIHEPHRAGLVPPHVTFVFGREDVSASTLVRNTARIAGQQRSFAISFDAAEIVHDGREGVYKLCLRARTGGETMHDLYDRLNSVPGPERGPSPVAYRPHMTVATNADAGAIEALDAREAGLLPAQGRLNALHVVRLVAGRLRSVSVLPFPDA